MWNRYFIALAVVALAALIPLTGCGSGDDESTSASDAKALIVKADFIQAANEACEKRGAEMKAKGARLIAKVSGESRNTAAKQVIDEVTAPGFEAEVKDLRALEPPPGDEAQVEEIIAAIQDMVDRMRSDLAAGRNYLYRKTENLAAAYGLPACGRP